MVVLTATYVYLRGIDDPQRKSDFDQVWFAAQAVWYHQNPYALIGIGKAFDWKWPFYYPLQAVVLVAPVGLLPVIAARCVFAGASVGLLAWCITRDGWSRLPMFLSMSFLVSVQLVQWSPLLTAALLAPSLSWIGVAKPNWAVAIVTSASTPRIWTPLLAGVGIMSVLAFILRSDWVSQWYAIVQTASHFRTDRLLERGTHFEMRGRSYRTRHLKETDGAPTADA